jgi:hypothetical protein
MTHEVISQVQRINALPSNMLDRMAPAFRQIQEASSIEFDASSAFALGPKWASALTSTTAVPPPAALKRQVKPKMRPPPEPEQPDDDESHLSASESNRPVPLKRTEDGGEGQPKAKGKGKQVVSNINV